MSYPTLSPCAMAPIVHAASKRRANSTSPADQPENPPRNVGYSDVHEAASGRSVTSTLELQPVKPVYTKSDLAANALSRKTSSIESYSENELSNRRVMNYEHLMQSSKPAGVDGCIDHNGNTKNWYHRDTPSLCSLDHHGHDCSCNDLIPINETDFGEMKNAHQHVEIFAAHEKNIEDGLIERVCSNAEQFWFPEGNISNLQSQKLSSGAGELFEVLPAAAEAYSRDSGEICSDSTSVSSASMTPESLSDSDIQQQGDQPCGLVEIGRCYIYLDTETGEYHSVVNRSFPSMLNTMNKESSRHRSVSHSNGHPPSTNSKSSTRILSHSMPTQFSSYRNRATEPSSFNFTFSKEDCVDGSADDCGQCIRCRHAFPDCVSAHLAEFYRQLSAPDHQSLGWDLDKDQLVQTYPGAVVCESEAKSRPQTRTSSCQCRGGKNPSAITCCADKKGAVCLRCCAPKPSSFEPDGNPMIIHAMASPTYSSFTASCSQVDDHAEVSEKDTNRYKSKCSNTNESFSQSYDDKGQPRLKCSTKRNTIKSLFSSFFGSQFSGKTRDESQKNDNIFDGRQQYLDSGSNCESQLRAALAPGDQHSTAGRDLADQTVAACDRPSSPQHSDGQLCEIRNRFLGSGEQTYKKLSGNPKSNHDNSDEDSEVNKEKLRIFRQLTRSFVAYLCCPPDALFTFGMPFHHLLETWGLPILIPERDLPVSGIKYQNMAECIEERCNGKIIVILSNSYANSEECLFLTYFAKTLDPDSRHKNIIPVLIDSNPEVPSVLRGLSFIKYNHLVRSGWLKEKLVNAIAA